MEETCQERITVPGASPVRLCLFLLRGDGGGSRGVDFAQCVPSICDPLASHSVLPYPAGNANGLGLRRGEGSRSSREWHFKCNSNYYIISVRFVSIIGGTCTEYDWDAGEERGDSFGKPLRRMQNFP